MVRSGAADSGAQAHLSSGLKDALVTYFSETLRGACAWHSGKPEPWTQGCFTCIVFPSVEAILRSYKRRLYGSLGGVPVPARCAARAAYNGSGSPEMGGRYSYPTPGIKGHHGLPSASSETPVISRAYTAGRPSSLPHHKATRHERSECDTGGRVRVG